MDNTDLENFWRSNDNKHAEGFYKAIVDRRKELVSNAERASKFHYVGLLLFWALALHQTQDVAFAGVKFSDPSVVMVLLATILSFLNYQNMVGSLHIVAIDQVLAAYTKVNLPAAQTLNLHRLLEASPSESSLGELGLLRKIRSVISNLTIVGLRAVFGITLHILMIGFVVTKVQLRAWDPIRLLLAATAILLTLRATWMSSEFIWIYIKNEWLNLRTRSKIAKKLFPKAESLSDAATKIALETGGKLNGNARLYVALTRFMACHELIDAFVKGEYENRDSLRANLEVKEAADGIRKQIHELEEAFHQQRHAFEQEPTNENESTLQSTLLKIRSHAETAQTFLLNETYRSRLQVRLKANQLGATPK